MGKTNLKWEELESKIEKAQKELYEDNEEEEIEEKTSRKKSKKEKVPKENKEKNIPKERIKKEKINAYKSSKKSTLPIIIGVFCLMLAIFSIIFALMNIDNNNIISGVKIEGIDVSELSREKAKEKINAVYEEKKQKEIVLKYGEYETTITPQLIDVNYDIDKAIEKAISLGRDSNIIINNYNILFAKIGKKNIKVDVSINEDEIKSIIESISSDIPGAVVEADYYVEDNKLIITKGSEGLKINTESLIEKIKDKIQCINSTQEYIEIPVINEQPEKIDIEKIHDEIYREVQDAYLTQSPFTIHPEVEGVDFNVDEAKALLNEDKEKYEIPLIITEPSVTMVQIGSEAFPDLLATYSTKYDGANINRTNNLELACEKINDKIVLAGETFSYNKTLGARTIAAGYKEAKVYENGEVVDGIGGGICQVSSTLYNSVLMANMEIIERKNHQFVTSYTPAGRDATVVYGQTDFKFKNTRTYAIKIKATCSNGIITISIYGIKEEIDCTVSFSTETISTIPYTVKYIDDNTLTAGTEKVKQIGANGMITETYIIKTLNGTVVSKELLSKDTYNAMQRIILKGTK